MATTSSSRTADGADGGHPPVGAAARVGRLERLPGWLQRTPIVLNWLRLALRHGSLTLPTCANPAITAGGLAGDGQLDYLGLMGERALAACATTVWLPCGGPESADEVEAKMQSHGLSYPVVLKPDLSRAGQGVRRVGNRGALLDYLARFPRGERILIQRLLPEDGEAGLYYLREPGRPRGRVVAMSLRHYPRVTGDGMRTVEQLIADNPRLQGLGQGGDADLDLDLERIPAHGEEVRVATVTALRVGALCEDGSALITQALSDAIDEIACDMQDFHAGCFNVKFASLVALRAGRGFSVVEVNGVGLEAAHALDPALGLREAFSIAFGMQRRLFEIGAAMRRRGHRPIGWPSVLRLALHQDSLIERYPPSN